MLLIRLCEVDLEKSEYQLNILKRIKISYDLGNLWANDNSAHHYCPANNGEMINSVAERLL